MTDAEANRPFVTRSDEGTALWHFDHLKVLKAMGEATGGRLAVWEELLPRHFSPPLHVHRDDDEAWYVLDGAITFQVDGTEHRVEAGDFLWAPRALPHSFRVESPTARMLGLALPARIEEFFVATARPASAHTLPPESTDLPAQEELIHAAHLAGCDIIGPPMPPGA